MDTMAVAHCQECGHDNNAQYLYCGMCGSPLKEPRPVAVKKEEAAPRQMQPITIGGYSILGLGAEPSFAEEELPEKKSRHADVAAPDDDAPRTAHYLLEDDEDEPRRPKIRMYLALLLLLTAAGALVWQWQQGEYPFSAPRPAPARKTSRAAVPPDADLGALGNPVASTPSEPPANQAVQPQPKPAPAIPVAPIAKEEKDTPAPQAEAAAPANDPEASQSAPPSRHETAPASNSADDNNADSNNDSQDAHPAPSPQRSAVSSPAVGTQQLLQDGEKYLYGNGVARDCDRAQKALRGAAGKSSEAASLLGTMYASGRCVARDLPTSYTWFARTLRLDPGNPRIQSDLEVLWKQMTPAERQLAMHPAQ